MKSLYLSICALYFRWQMQRQKGVFQWSKNCGKMLIFVMHFINSVGGIMTENKNILIDIFFTCIKYKIRYFNFMIFF